MNLSPAIILQSLMVSPIESDEEALFQDPEDSDPEWPLFIASTPEDPDNCGTIYDTAGVPNGFAKGELCQHFGIQVRIRCNSYEDGWKKAEDVRQQLPDLAQQEVTIDGVTYRVGSVTPTSTVISLGAEGGTGRRVLFTINFLATITEVTS